jgi:2-keto-4-pentenoate hydratase/2-oxohepta-3-ene-1,7-dioic acid hydratase in catechol pathway
MGPWAVTKDELDLETAAVRCFVNGDIRQDSKIALLIFDIPTIISTLSQGITLNPGDIIATGTPAGVGIGFDPPKYLTAGDVVRVEIDGIGALENRFAERRQ